MNERDFQKLTRLGREQLLRVLDELDRRRRVVVALIRATPRGTAKGKRDRAEAEK